MQNNLIYKIAEERTKKFRCSSESQISREEESLLGKEFWGVVNFLYQENGANLYDMDCDVGKMFGRRMFGAADLSILVDLMKDFGVIRKDAYPYRLSSRYERMLDELFMSNLS